MTYYDKILSTTDQEGNIGLELEHECFSDSGMRLGKLTERLTIDSKTKCPECGKWLYFTDVSFFNPKIKVRADCHACGKSYN